MAKVTREQLARYHDGELSASERARVEEALRSSPEDRAYLARLDALGDYLRIMHEEQAAAVSFEGFAERVAAGVRAAERPSAGERFRVWVAEFFEHRRAVWIPAVSLAGAAAAVLLVLPLLRAPAPVAPIPHGGGAGGVWMASAGALPATAPRGSAASLTNRGQVNGVELTVVNERGESFGVVWVND